MVCNRCFDDLLIYIYVNQSTMDQTIHFFELSLLFLVNNSILLNMRLDFSLTMTTNGTMCFVNMILFISCLVFTYLCDLFPSQMTRINSQPFASQIGRHFGQQSHHFQSLIWHIYHKSKADRFIHIVTFVIDTLIWVFFIAYYLPMYLQLIIISILILQALSAGMRFTMNSLDDTSNTDIGQSKCIDCETHHAYPKNMEHYISWFRLQWTLKHNYICVLSSFVWILLYCSSHICLSLINCSRLSLPYVLEMMHAIIVLNALFRVIGHFVEPIPPFLIDNEHFSKLSNINMLSIMVFDRGEIFRLFQITIVGYLSEYQAGLLLRFPQVFINTWISLLVKPSDGKSVLRHYREQACRIRSKGWKATHLTKNMFEACYH